MFGADEEIVLNLDELEGRERAAAWAKWTSSAFPGITVKQTQGKRATGIVRLVPLGAARFWKIVSTRQTLENDATGLAPNDILVALILQKGGVTVVSQEGRSARLNSGDMTVVDGKAPFAIESIGLSQTAVCVFPRVMASEHFPALVKQSAQVIDKQQPLAKMIRHIIDSVFSNDRAFSEVEQIGVLRAFHVLIGALQLPKDENSQSVHWRVSKALEAIDQAIDDADLDADQVAASQNISRRRLDQLFMKEIASTISAQILDRRLTYAAADLCDPHHKERYITELAFNAGFKDSAHFSRSFKKRFGYSPRDWRQRHLTTGASKGG